MWCPIHSIEIRVVVVIIVGAWCIFASFAGSWSRSNCYRNDSSLMTLHSSSHKRWSKSLPSFQHMHADNSYYQIKFNFRIQRHVSDSSHIPYVNVPNVTEYYKSVRLSFLDVTNGAWFRWGRPLDTTQIRPGNDVCFLFKFIELFIATTSVDVRISRSNDLAELDGEDVHVRWCFSE